MFLAKAIQSQELGRTWLGDSRDTMNPVLIICKTPHKTGKHKGENNKVQRKITAPQKQKRESRIPPAPLPLEQMLHLGSAVVYLSRSSSSGRQSSLLLFVIHHILLLQLSSYLQHVVFYCITRLSIFRISSRFVGVCMFVCFLLWLPYVVRWLVLQQRVNRFGWTVHRIIEYLKLEVTR